MKLIKIGVLSVSMFLLCLAAVHAAGEQERAFTWNMALQNIGSGTMVPFSAPVKAATGERFRIVVQPEIDSHCYIVAEDASGKMVVLFAGSLKAKQNWHSPAFQLVPPGGRETFFVIVTQHEQKSLAGRIAAFKTNPSVMNRRAVMREVDALRSHVSQFKEVPEKPVLMGGASRGTEADNQGLLFSGLSAYVKTVSIEH